MSTPHHISCSDWGERCIFSYWHNTTHFISAHSEKNTSHYSLSYTTLFFQKIVFLRDEIQLMFQQKSTSLLLFLSIKPFSASVSHSSHFQLERIKIWEVSNGRKTLLECTWQLKVILTQQQGSLTPFLNSEIQYRSSFMSKKREGDGGKRFWWVLSLIRSEGIWPSSFCDQFFTALLAGLWVRRRDVEWTSSSLGAPISPEELSSGGERSQMRVGGCRFKYVD